MNAASKILIFFFCFSLGGISLAQTNSSDVARFSNGVLELPLVRIEDKYFHMTLSLSNTEPFTLTTLNMDERVSPLSDSLVAPFVDDKLTVNCLRVDDDYYRLEMTLAATEPNTVFDQLSANATAKCAQTETGQLTFLSPHSNPIAIAGSFVYATNTPADTVDVIDRTSMQLVSRIQVGIDPVSIAIKPNGLEIWVANHISDSVSVIDSDPNSPTFHTVIHTIQDIDPNTKATRFDEPVGIAFANDNKAYVALSSTDRIAIIDTDQKIVNGHLQINAQDPRAIAVRNGKLFVTAFESNNQSELSGCFGQIDGDQCTFSLLEHVVNNNNVLSLNYDADIVKDPRVPDRDLFIYDTSSDLLIDTVSSVGTLLYGITVDSAGKVFIAQTDARNTANGRAGSLKQTLADLENRAFLNQVAVVDCQASTCSQARAIELEPLPPQHPTAGTAVATPYAIQVSEDDRTLLVSAAGSNQIVTIDANTDEILGRVDVGVVPRGISLESDSSGAPERAWILNAVDNSVSVVDLSELEQPQLIATIALADPTDPELKLGRAAFNNANASSTGTFSCESCHPDGHTDQLLWVLGGPQCNLAGCNQIPPRSTMPIRGLRDTAPFHWDGVPGDPFGGNNGQDPLGLVAPNCELDNPESCTRFLIDGALASTMCDQTNCPNNNEGKEGLLTGAERDAMSKFLLSIPHPPARDRAFDDELSASAKKGFDDFFVQDAPPGSVSPTCGSVGCHNMPFWTGSNAGGNGMDAPSFRGLQDRWLLLPQGRVNMFELAGSTFGQKGFDEFAMWTQLISGSTPDEFQMFIEASMGYPGAFARQITLNRLTAANQGISETESLLSAIETAASEGTLLLQGEGIEILASETAPLSLYFDNERYRIVGSDASYTRAELLEKAASGEVIATLTGNLQEHINYENPQPEIWSTQPLFTVTKIAFPRLFDNEEMRVKGRFLGNEVKIYVDGRQTDGSVNCESGQMPDCLNEVVLIQLEQMPSETGMHFLQLQSDRGLMSNEYLFFVNR